MAQWLRLCAPASGGTDSILGQDPRVQGIAAPPLDPPQKKKILRHLGLNPDARLFLVRRPRASHFAFRSLSLRPSVKWACVQ